MMKLTCKGFDCEEQNDVWIFLIAFNVDILFKYKHKLRRSKYIKNVRR